MSLSDINEKLHSRSEEPKVKKEEVFPETPGTSTHPAAPDIPLTLGEAWGGNEKREEPVAPGLPSHNPLLRIPRKVALALGGVALISLAAGIFFKAGGWLFTPENVQITINGPKEIDSNQMAEYTVSFENNNWVDLENAELIITYPTIFRFLPESGVEASASRAVIALGTVKKSSLSSVKIRGSFQSLQDQVALITATLRASPSGFTNQVDFENRYSVAVEGSSLIIDLAAPLQVGDGQFADYVVTYRNESAVEIENLELRLSYPEGFTPKEFTPRPSRAENVWNVSRLTPGESGVVTVRGIITGAQGDVKRVIAELGIPQGDGSLFSYADIVRQTRIIASPLVISQAFGDGDKKAVAPGESLYYRIFFRNNGDVGLRDLIVTVDLDPKYFDVSQIQLDGGTYNVQKRQAIFRASDRAVLSLVEPGQSGTLSFSVPVRGDLASYKESNIEMESVAKIDSPDIPTPIGANKIIASNRISFKVMTGLVLDIKGYHFDSFGNTGPMPPTVGNETTYTLTVRVASTINAMEGARAMLTVPGQVRYIKTQSVSQGNVIYNDRSGEIFWNIGTIAPGVSQMTELSIQLGFTPDPSQVGDESALTNTLNFTATDMWSGEPLARELPPKSINLREDVQLQTTGGQEVRAN